MKRQRSLIRRAVYLVVLAIVAGLIAYSFRPAPVSVTLQSVLSGPLSVTVLDDGVTRIKEKYTVSAPLAGRLQRLELHPGDAVEAGQTILAVLDPQPPSLLDTRSRAEAEARVATAESQRQAAEPQLEQAKATATIADEEFKRAEELYQRKGLSHEAYDRARLEARLATERRRVAEFGLLVAEHELQLARAALIHTQRDAQESNDQADDWRMEIRSPVMGRVLRVFQESAAAVSAGDPILEIGDPQDLEIVVDVLSSDAVRIRPGQSAQLLHWGGPIPLPARVRLVEPSGFTKISALGVEEQRVNVILDLTDPQAHGNLLGDAFRVDVNIEVDRIDQATLAPSTAIFPSGGQSAVFVVQNGRARIRTVQTGRRGDSQTEILSGLQPGESVVIFPSDKVADGVLVQEAL